MADTAKIFWTGRSQAVRLPKEFRFEGTEVRIRRQGRGVYLEPAGYTAEDIADDDARALEALRALIQEGIDSGDAGPWDVEEIKREARVRRDARR